MAQRRVLRELVAKAAGTRFGRQHDFAGIRTVADFQRRVPLRTYGQLWDEFWKKRFPELDNVDLARPDAVLRGLVRHRERQGQAHPLLARDGALERAGGARALRPPPGRHAGQPDPRRQPLHAGRQHRPEGAGPGRARRRHQRHRGLLPALVEPPLRLPAAEVALHHRLGRKDRHDRPALARADDPRHLGRPRLAAGVVREAGEPEAGHARPHRRHLPGSGAADPRRGRLRVLSQTLRGAARGQRGEAARGLRGLGRLRRRRGPRHRRGHAADRRQRPVLRVRPGRGGRQAQPGPALGRHGRDRGRLRDRAHDLRRPVGVRDRRRGAVRQHEAAAHPDHRPHLLHALRLRRAPDGRAGRDLRAGGGARGRPRRGGVRGRHRVRAGPRRVGSARLRRRVRGRRAGRGPPRGVPRPPRPRAGRAQRGLRGTPQGPDRPEGARRRADAARRLRALAQEPRPARRAEQGAEGDRRPGGARRPARCSRRSSGGGSPQGAGPGTSAGIHPSRR